MATFVNRSDQKMNMASASCDKKVKVWQWKNENTQDEMQCINELPIANKDINCVVSLDREILAIGTDDRTVIVLNSLA